MHKKGTWLTKKWLAEWQQVTSVARWQKGKSIHQQQRLVEVSFSEREITGVVKGGEVYLQQITSERMEETELEEINEAFLKDPSLVMSIYLKTRSDGYLGEPLRSIFSMPKLAFSCTCSNEPTPCKHLAAVAMAAAVEMEKDPSKLFLFRGIPWHMILQQVGSKEPLNDEALHVNYSMVALPSQPNLTPVSRKGRPSPSFWVSPFPFTLIMEEIYTKVDEDTEDEETGF